ncbi:unnamed protein product, partial [Adineta steineri]
LMENLKAKLSAASVNAQHSSELYKVVFQHVMDNHGYLIMDFVSQDEIHYLIKKPCCFLPFTKERREFRR